MDQIIDKVKVQLAERKLSGLCLICGSEMQWEPYWDNEQIHVCSAGRECRPK